MKSAVAPCVLAVLLTAALAASAGEADATGEQPEASPDHPVVFWELACHDAEASVEFFRNSFGWQISQSPNSILYNVQTATEDGGISGGIFTLQKAKLPFLTVYILVDDIEERARLIEEHGGLIIEEPHEIQGGLWICLFNDPSGVTFAMLQQASRAEE
jgi:predicted enzyme related to lactoylglutathione lyase